ncbi:MAG: clathrin adaptor complex small chain-domain-containing protein [Linnemannia gamsii]|nr:MAG: clathrin adaptor complex small chain-domain-containing protein [Linnemannia gamsii]
MAYTARPPSERCGKSSHCRFWYDNVAIRPEKVVQRLTLVAFDFSLLSSSSELKDFRTSSSSSLSQQAHGTWNFTLAIQDTGQQGIYPSEMPINYVLLVSRQGKTRLAKWFTTLSPKEKSKIVKDVTQLVLARRTKMCNFLEYRDTKVIYRRYASLYFIAGVGPQDNELITLEIIHRYVEVLDRYFGNVSELDLIFNFERAYYMLDELLIAGEMQESSKLAVLKAINDHDAVEMEEANEEKNK